MCHVYFVSTAIDRWSGFRGYTVIFRHVSIPLNSSGACVYVQKQRCLLHQISLSVCVFSCLGNESETEKNPSKTKVESNKHREDEGRERERLNEEKAYYQKTDGPPIHSGPTGDLEGQLFAPPGYQHCREGWST